MPNDSISHWFSSYPVNPCSSSLPWPQLALHACIPGPAFSEPENICSPHSTLPPDSTRLLSSKPTSLRVFAVEVDGGIT